MVQRVFLSKRIELTTVASVLASDVPIPCQRVLDHRINATEADFLANCVYEVLESCQHWGTLIEQTSDDSLSFQHRLRCQAKAFLLFLELCERRADVSESFTMDCLQRPVSALRSNRADRSTWDSLESKSAVTLAVSRKSLGFMFLMIPLEEAVIITHGPVEDGGRRALGIISSSLDMNPALIEIDLRLKITFQNYALLNTNNLSWLPGSISDLAASIQGVSSEILLLVQSTMPGDAGCVIGEAKDWLGSCFGEAEGGARGSMCRPDERSTGPDVYLEHRRTNSGSRSSSSGGDGNTSNITGSAPSSAFMRSAAHIAGTDVRRLYEEARTKAVLFSLLSQCGGSLHSSLSNTVATELLPLVSAEFIGSNPS